jgi:hypothetical protein
MKHFYKILFIIFLLPLPACKWATGAGTPFFKWSNINIPEGTPTFQQGFKDGCSTVLYARGNEWYRTRYSYRYDPKLIGNPEYRFGHSRGYTYCFQSIIGPLPLASFDRYISPYGNNPVFEMSVADGAINKAWGGFFATPGESVLGGSATPGTDGGFDAMFGLWGGGGSGSVFGAHPLWAGGSKNQIFGQ